MWRPPTPSMLLQESWDLTAFVDRLDSWYSSATPVCGLVGEGTLTLDYSGRFAAAGVPCCLLAATPCEGRRYQIPSPDWTVYKRSSGSCNAAVPDHVALTKSARNYWCNRRRTPFMRSTPTRRRSRQAATRRGSSTVPSRRSRRFRRLSSPNPPHGT